MVNASVEQDIRRQNGHGVFNTSMVARAALVDANEWERRKLGAWRRSGRLTEEGTLRLTSERVRPHTLGSVRKMWRRQRLTHLDAVNALILANGVVPRGFMSAHKNIRETLENIADERLRRLFRGAEVAEMLTAIIRREIGAMADEALRALRASSDIGPPRVGRRHRRGSTGLAGSAQCRT